MNIICPLAHKTTMQEYKNEVSGITGAITFINHTALFDLSSDSIQTMQTNLEASIAEIQKIKARLTLDLEALETSRFLCCHVDHNRFFTISSSLIESGMIMAAGVLTYTEDNPYLKALGITCLVASQLLSKTNDYFADRSEQMSTREAALKNRLLNCKLIESTAKNAAFLLSHPEHEGVIDLLTQTAQELKTVSDPDFVLSKVIQKVKIANQPVDPLSRQPSTNHYFMLNQVDGALDSSWSYMPGF